MTNEEKEIEATNNDVIFPYKGVQNLINITKDIPNYDHVYLLNSNEKYIKQPSMAQGTAAFCLETLEAHEVLHQAQAKIKRDKEEGVSFCEKIQSARRISAGSVFKL